MNSSASSTDSDELKDRFVDDPRLGDAFRIEQMVIRVLRRAHREAAVEPAHETRALHHVAHCFADELATTNPRFDRLRFLKAVTERRV